MSANGPQMSTRVRGKTRTLGVRMFPKKCPREEQYGRPINEPTNPKKTIF